MGLKSLARNLGPIVRCVRRWDTRLRAMLVKLSPVLASRYIYFTVRGRRLNLKNPKYLSEKLNWIKLFWRDPRLIQCTDKFEVRSYVSGRGHADILNELYGVYDNIAAVPWDDLQHRFVVKCTHGCGCNIICADKSRLDIDDALQKLSRWMRTDYALSMAEMHYRRIRPRIICEKYLGTESGRYPVDYKIHCFNGAARMILVCTGRETKLRLTFRDRDWQVMDVAVPAHPPERDQERPPQLPKMIAIAETLAVGIPFVRVDFYVVQGRIVFGEMTFTPAGGFVAYFEREKGDRFLGSWLTLPGAPPEGRR